VRFLLDVNALLAFGVFEHRFHQRVSGWVSRLETTGEPELATCSITELGLIRVLAQSSEYGFDIRGARRLLLRLKTGSIPSLTTWIFRSFPVGCPPGPDDRWLSAAIGQRQRLSILYAR
jgi:hypothetical protein